MIVNIVAGFILFFSIIGGITQGAIKSFFSLVSFIIAIPIATMFYQFFAGLLGFLPGEDWENFIGFFIALAIASIVLSFIFFFPRKLLEKSWHEGPPFRIIGGILNFLGAGIGLTMFTLLISAYPVWNWLQQAMVGSEVIQWLATNLDFVEELMPRSTTF